LYGATTGEVLMGLLGNVLCNVIPAKAVVEGIGDHGCEYMTGVS
jgi:glutamate synthase domain-containing protein 3